MAQYLGLLLLAVPIHCYSFRVVTRCTLFAASGHERVASSVYPTPLTDVSMFARATQKIEQGKAGRGPLFLSARACGAFQTPARTQRRVGSSVLWALEGDEGQRGEEASNQDFPEDSSAPPSHDGGKDDDDVDDAEQEALEGGAETLELRDFRARLMSKGLDGWGVEEEKGEGAGGKEGGASVNSERWAHPLVRPELGCLALANGELFTAQQQYFYRAVILIIQHGDDGTVGLILNRPTAFTMGDVCKGDLAKVPGLEDNVLYMGGDVAGARDDGMDVVNLLHGRDDVPGIEVVKGLRLGGLKEALPLVAEGEASPDEFKFFSRYSGWGPGQLEAEVMGGHWSLAACDVESVLRNHNHPDQPGHFWREIMSRLRRHQGIEEEAGRNG